MSTPHKIDTTSEREPPQPRPGWRRGIGLVAALAMLVALESGEFLKLDGHFPSKRSHRTSLSATSKKAATYLASHLELYKLGHYVKRHGAGLARSQGNRETKLAARVERARAREARRHFGWLAYRGMAPVYLGAVLALSLWMGLLLEERTLPALRSVCVAARVPDDVAGATVLALATGGFEVLFSTVETVEGRVGVGLNFVLGSGVVNFGLLPFVVACAARVARGAKALPIDLDPVPVARDGAFALLAFAALLWVVADEFVSLAEALGLLGLYAAHVLACFLGPRPASTPPASPKAELELGSPARLPLKSSTTPPASPRRAADDKGHAVRTPRERVLDAARLLLPPPLPAATAPGARAALRDAAPTLVGSGLWLAALLLLLTRLADLLALSARLPLAFAGAVFLPAVYAIPDVLVSANIASSGHGRAAVSTVLGVQVVTVLLGVGIPFTVHGCLSAKPVAVSGVDCVPALRYGVFLIGALFVGSVLGPLALRRPPSFGAPQAALVVVAYVAISAVVARRTLAPG